MKYCYKGKQLCGRDFLWMVLRELRHFYEILLLKVHRWCVGKRR